MKSEILISNLDHLRQENKLQEYVEQFYFFLATAVQKEDAKLLHTLLDQYVREVVYLDDRVRLYQLLQAAETFMNLPEYKEYRALFYLMKGNVLYVSLEYEKAIENYKRAISAAAETQDFHVLGVALNNSMAFSNHFELNERKVVSLMSSVFICMTNGQQRRKQYMLLILPIEIALDLQQYDYAQQLLDALNAQVVHENIILRELRQLDVVQLRIYLKSKKYDVFFAKLAELQSAGFQHQYDLQQVMYEYAIEAADGINDAEAKQHYKQQYERCEQLRSKIAQKLQRYKVKTEELMRYMIRFEVLKKKANRHIERGALPQYTVIMFHVERQHLSDEELKTLQLAMHEHMLPNLQSILFGCTMVSSSKMLYVFKQTEAEMIVYLRQHIKPIIAAYRQKTNKSFRVIISYVQNDLYDYNTFEQILQYSYALMYYERYNGKEALLNA
ncbi:hypothetical protein [Caryophanon latum]|uniref:Uncharacterized protein n=1 Tax=Caryophanon latum TaxID=33977 RepID=A0A1C0YPS2_9BACL|nr:hypothetical protein [Caryophanon latum]OCS89168.1 hypothetical protein A6K76_02325 [Caryophanon latum]